MNRRNCHGQYYNFSNIINNFMGYIPISIKTFTSNFFSIQFTLENKIDGKLKFPELQVKRVDNYQLKFEIYQKKTYNSWYILRFKTL